MKSREEVKQLIEKLLSGEIPVCESLKEIFERFDNDVDKIVDEFMRLAEKDRLYRDRKLG